MNNEELIGIVLKVLQLQEQGTSERKFHLLDGVIKGHAEAMDALWEKMNKLEVHFGNMNIRINNLEKRVFEIPSPTEAASSKEPSERSKAQTGVKRGPYKKRKKKAPIKVTDRHLHSQERYLGINTIKKYVRKIKRTLSTSKHFSETQLLTEVKRLHSNISAFTGREMMEQIQKARWRLDHKRRRSLGKSK